MPIPKTNAVRLLDSLGIEYKLLEYEVDLDDLTAESTAQKLELAPEQVFKTLVVRSNSNQIYFAVIPGNARLNFKALAKLAKERKVEMVSLKELKLLTGYIRGGVTAMASKKDYPVFVDETIEVFDRITVSAGVRGTLIMLTPQDYLQVVEGVVGDIALLD
ncbi:MAG: Cys-tRNA(Pro) deacylase [Pleurocapsa sp. MO_226.B13]|nr:Cys-tRNA(Pro) deacylase [Pleurocapsa sp. MO_226.B13]